MTTVAGRWIDWWRSCSRRDGLPLWYLPWMPAILLMMDDSPDPSSAAIRLATVAILALTIWATGRGGAGGASEAIFVAAIALTWIGAVASILWMRGFPESLEGRALLVVVNAAAAAVGLWAWRRRRAMPVLETSHRDDASPRRPKGRLAILVWVGVYAAVIFLLGAPILPEGIVMAAALALYVVLAARGRGMDGSGPDGSER